MANEVKTFTVVDTETQRTKEIKSTATTVAELKRDLRQNGFNVDGKTIQEALTRVEFKDDEALLPHDVSYRGNITNDLVFRLTKTNKQVKSGMDRKQAYDEVKKQGLGDAIKARFGKNFTQVSTSDLVAFIEANGKKGAPAKKAPEAPAKPACKKETPAENCKCEDYLRNLVALLIDNGTIDEEDKEFIFGPEVEAAASTEDGAKYGKDELNALLRGL